jgi:flagellar biosynthesis anti-sigma factor FlgM
MIMKINDARSLNQPAAYDTLGQVPDANTAQSETDASPQPAAKINLSQAAQDTRSAAPAEVDQALVQEIRHRIQNGTFKIDYNQVTQGLVRDALLATRS